MKIQVKINDQVFDVEVGNLAARPVLAKIDGETFEVWPEMEERQESVAAPREEPKPAPVAQREEPKPAPAAPKAAPVAASSNGNKSKAITAPIPGVIISIAVKPGDSVTSGQELCMLEAMKMKNAIRATREGTIGAVLVAVGDQVRHGQALVEFAD